MTEAKQKLILAEGKTKELFSETEKRGLIIPGKSESQLSEEIVKLAYDLFGIDKHWHKKIVRTGVNTLATYTENPPDKIIQHDDILFLDFGPIFQGYEADVGRTFVLGSNPLKLKIKKDVEDAWYEAKAWYDQHAILTGAAYFNYITALAKKYGWEFAGDIAGHIVGEFPHEQPDDPKDLCFDIHPGNHTDILQLDKNGNSRQWVLEIQFVDRANNIGSYFEQLLN